MDAIDNILGRHYNDVALLFSAHGIKMRGRNRKITREKLIEVLSDPLLGEDLTTELFERINTAGFTDPSYESKKQAFQQSVLRVLYAAAGIPVDDDGAEELSAEELKQKKAKDTFRVLVIITVLLAVAYFIIKE